MPLHLIENEKVTALQSGDTIEHRNHMYAFYRRDILLNIVSCTEVEPCHFTFLTPHDYIQLLGLASGLEIIEVTDRSQTDDIRKWVVQPHL